MRKWYYFIMGLLAAAISGVQAFVGSPEGLAEIGELVGNAGLAGVIVPAVMFAFGALFNFLKGKSEEPEEPQV